MGNTIIKKKFKRKNSDESMEHFQLKEAVIINNPKNHIFEQILSVQKCRSAIKMNLRDNMTFCSGPRKILNDIESKIITKQNLFATFEKVQETHINVAFLWAIFMQRFDLLSDFIALGADLNYKERCQNMGALHLAVFSGCVTSVNFLIERRIDVNEFSTYFTALHWAIIANRPEILMILLKNNVDVHAITGIIKNKDARVLHRRLNATSAIKLLPIGAIIQLDYSGLPPLHLAAALGRIRCLKIIFDTHQHNLNAKTKEDQMTPLHFAAKSGYIDCLEFLLENGGLVNEISGAGQTALHLAAQSHAFDCVELLLRKGGADPNISDDDGQTPLHLAGDTLRDVESCHSIAVLIAWGANTNSRNRKGETPLYVAARAQDYGAVEVLLRKGGADPNIADDGKRTPLHVSINESENACDIIKVLLDWGADVNAKERNDHTPLQIAQLKEITQCVDILASNKEKYSPENAPITNVLGISPETLHTFQRYVETSPNRKSIAAKCYAAIKLNLLDYTVPNIRYIFDGIEKGEIVGENLRYQFRMKHSVINLIFLWAAFQKRIDLLEELLDLGAQIEYWEPRQGLSALHLAAFSGCPDTLQFLINRGADVNASFLCYTPLHCAVLGDSIETTSLLLGYMANANALTNKTYETILHYIQVNSLASVKFLHRGGAIFQLEYAGFTTMHLASVLGHYECLKTILEKVSIGINKKSKGEDFTALHLSSEVGYIDCVEILLEYGADVNLKNYRGKTPLHLAVQTQNYDCVKLLLRQGGADPNIKDDKGRTPLHCATNTSNPSHDIIQALITQGADINAAKRNGFTPLHLAALNELSECVNILIFRGGDITAMTKSGWTALGLIKRKTPASLDIIMDNLDADITYYGAESPDKEEEIRLDFESILEHCHPKESVFLNTFVNEDHNEILLHPLCSAFLFLKWRKLRKYYLVRILFSFILVTILSVYELTSLVNGCDEQIEMKQNRSDIKIYLFCHEESLIGYFLKNNLLEFQTQRKVLIGLGICEVLRKMYGVFAYQNMKQYLLNYGTIIEWIVLISIFVICLTTNSDGPYAWQNHIGAFAVLLGWTNLMLMIGQLPAFGAYVAMYTRVQREFAKLLLAYVCLLIGFTISFCVIFPYSTFFANPFIGLTTIVVMMTGELQLDLVDTSGENLPKIPLFIEISAQLLFILFTFFVSVTLMNLLIGIAVHDIEGLHKTAELSKLVRQTKLIAHIESALCNPYLPNFLLNWCHKNALIWPQKYKKVLNIQPLNPREKQLPLEILKAAYEVARKKRRCGYRTSQSIQDKNDTNKVLTNDNVLATDSDIDYDGLNTKMSQMQNEMVELKIEIRALISKMNSVK